MLADAARVMPPSMIFEADQRFYENGLDQADVIVHGRHSKEQQQRSPLRRRLVMTRTIESIAAHPRNPKALLWNPAEALLEDALAWFEIPEPNIAVIGGPEVFAFFLGLYSAFHLSRAPGVWLPGGRPAFPEVPVQSPEEILATHGLFPDAPTILDEGKRLLTASWRRQPAMEPGPLPRNSCHAR
jgi:dihydrofolate reductase